MQTHQSTQCAELLFPLLQKQLELVRDFSDYLQLIKQAISDNDKDLLNQLASENKLDVNSIEQLQLKQQEVVAAYGFSPSTEGVSEYIKNCQQTRLTELHNALKQQLQEFQNALMINDLLVKKNQQRVRQSIRLLSGHLQEGSSVTYSSSGNTSDDSPSGHTLARA